MEKQDAQTFADWGVDYLKYDNCYNEGQEGTALITYTRYKAMSDALNATGNMLGFREEYALTSQADPFSIQCATGGRIIHGIGPRLSPIVGG